MKFLFVDFEDSKKAGISIADPLFGILDTLENERMVLDFLYRYAVGWVPYEHSSKQVTSFVIKMTRDFDFCSGNLVK